MDPATDFDPTLSETQLAGNPTRNSSELGASLHLEYDFGSGRRPFTIMADVSHRDDVFFTEFHRFVEGQTSYTMVDLNLRYRSADERLTTDLWVKNANDELAASSTFQLATARTVGVTYLPPRTYGATVGYRF